MRAELKPVVGQRVVFVAAVIGILAPAVIARPSAAPALRLYVLDCGSIDVLDISLFSPGVDVGERRTLANPCYLVVHPDGTLLWDAGLPDELAGASGADTLLGTFVLHVRKTLAAQLRQIGHTPETIDYLGLSHMHFDHVGNVDLFPRSTLLIQREEYEAAFGPDPGKYFLDPATYRTLRHNPVERLAGHHDVFGDGTVVIRRALGHTPGHQALYLELPASGNVLLSGDLVHFADNWTHKRVPGSNFDRALSLRTMDEIEAFLAANDAALWIQHDPEQYAVLQHAPAYYD